VRKAAQEKSAQFAGIFALKSCQEKATLFAKTQNLLLTHHEENSFAFALFFLTQRRNELGLLLGRVKFPIENHRF
jgi:hypothetical protein